ncbi:MAG TPA: hypothetical protein VFD77_05075 [Brumimicrobium sp.]|nr:hypothetical protein [Brumimicrobium sp.]
MSDYSILIKETAADFNGGYYQVNSIIITNNINKFMISSRNPFVTVSDSNGFIDSFLVELSGNQKELIAFFTIDAFTIFTGNVSIVFGDGISSDGSFLNIDINSIIEPLDPLAASLNPLPGDNDWLNSLNL